MKWGGRVLGGRPAVSKAAGVIAVSPWPRSPKPIGIGSHSL